MDNQENITNEVITTTSDTNTESSMYIKFKNSYIFEGQTYDGIDLSNIENISTRDLVEADKLFYSTGNIAPTSEMSLAYTCIVASKVAKKPLEFFTNLPGNEGIRVKNVIVNFLYN